MVSSGEESGRGARGCSCSEEAGDGDGTAWGRGAATGAGEGEAAGVGFSEATVDATAVDREDGFCAVVAVAA